MRLLCLIDPIRRPVCTPSELRSVHEASDVTSIAVVKSVTDC